MPGPLLVTAAATGVVGAAFVAAGIRVARKRSWVGDRRAIQALSAWWLLMGTKSILSSLREGFALRLDVDIYALLVYVEGAAAFTALAGLTCYLYYLWFGRYFRRSLAAGFLLPAGVYIWSLAAHGPTAVVVKGYSATIVYAEALPAAIHWALLAGFYGPLLILAAGFAYLGHATPSVRERAWQIAATLAAVTGADLLALGAAHASAFTVLIPVLRLTAAALVLWAYASPAQRRSAYRLTRTDGAPQRHDEGP